MKLELYCIIIRESVKYKSEMQGGKKTHTTRSYWHFDLQGQGHREESTQKKECSVTSWICS